METSEVLYTAADLIERKGWWSSPNGATKGIYCASNAIRCVDVQAKSSAREQVEHQRTFAAYLGGHYCGDIFHWNDEVGRTKTDVLAALRAAAASEESKERADAPEAVAVR